MSEHQRLVVHGRGHPELGRVVTKGVGGDGWSAGLAHSRGIRHKTRPSLSPNEDSAFIVTDGRTYVWAGVADGHHGDYSSWHAMEFLADRPDLLLDDRVGVIDALYAGNVRLERERPREQPESRTTVVAARLDLTDGELRWVAMGDSTVGVQTRPGRYTRLNFHQHWFHGFWMETRYSAEMNWELGIERLEPGAVVVLASDGWTDYLPRGTKEGRAVEAATVHAADSERSAEHLLIPRDALMQNAAGYYVFNAVGGDAETPATAMPVPVRVIFGLGDRVA
ncbi:MAG: protein phosphatase 2C domain-containing protein, partial [Actinomycetota bacterium]